MRKSLNYILKTLRKRALRKLCSAFFGNIDQYGRFEIISRDVKTGKEKKVGTVDNLITDWAHNTIAKCLLGYNPVSAGIEVKYVAIGDDNTAPSGSDETLVNEVFRNPYVQRSNSDSGETTIEFYISDTDYAGTIEEIGIFCGPSATSTADTGNLLSRAFQPQFHSICE